MGKKATLFEMANVRKNRTGLPMIIWISPKYANHGARIKVQKTYGNNVDFGNTFSLTVEDNPRVFGNTGEIKQSDIELAKEFVKLNKQALLDYWTGAEEDTANAIFNLVRV